MAPRSSKACRCSAFLVAVFGTLFAPAGAQGQVSVAEHGHQQAALEREDVMASSIDARPVAIEGRILDADGLPVAGAVVVSSAGGSAVSESDGWFHLAVAQCPWDAGMDVTAVAAVNGRTAMSSVRVTPVASTARAGTMFLKEGAGCAPSWLPTFGGQPGTDGRVFALTVFDDGSGPALYAGGSFTTPGNVTARRVARWDGASWAPLGSGMNADVYALAVFDDGSGPALYAAGDFTSAGGVSAKRIAKWDGTSWSPLGAGMNLGIRTLLVFDDGSGPALYAGGWFTTAGSASANYVAKWNGRGWAALGSGMGGVATPDVFALAAFDDGSGPALYAGGDFTTAGGAAANRIAKWDGTSWSALGSGTDGEVASLAVFDDGGGPALYAGGAFTAAGGLAANYVATWDGTSWSALGSGVSGGFTDVNALTVFDDGSGPALYAGGDFTTAGGVAANYMAKWDGTSWSGLGSGLGDGVHALTVVDDGNGPKLYAGGRFDAAGGVPASSIAEWDGRSWSSLGSGVNDNVLALTVYDDGSGPALYAGGSLSGAGGVAAEDIAKWDGASWSALGSGTNGPVRAITVFDDGNGPALYAGGTFSAAGGVAANAVAKWDGANWSPVGDGMGGAGVLSVFALAALDDGSGLALYAGGRFTIAGGVAANNIAKWDGATWSALGSGMNDDVLSLVAFDDGGGQAPYAGGEFTTAGGVVVNHIAKWDGTSWSALEGGMGGGAISAVSDLAVFDDGSGPALYAGGRFMTAGGMATNSIAKWDGTGWSALGSGTTGEILALAVFDDGRGPALYAGGNFTTVGGVAAKHIASWNGTSWSAWEGGMNSRVEALTVFDDGGGPALYAGGWFTTSPAGDSYLAKWGCEAPSPTTYCTAGTSASGCQALLSATGTASASATSGFTLQASTVEGAKDGLFFFGTNGQQANPWGNGTGYQCVVPPVVRAPLMNGTGSSGLCDGSFALDLNALWCPTCPSPAKNPGAGSTVQAQLWYRDPASTSNQTTSLSDAIEFLVGP